MLWPVFHNRLDLAQFEAGFFEQYLGVNRRLARLLQPLLRPDDVIWVHDYHLIPFAAELRKLGVENPIGFFLHIPFPPWQTFMAIPEHQELARMIAAYDLFGLQTKADVANLLAYLENGVYGRIVPDGRMRLFGRLASVASFPIGIDVDYFAGAGREAGLVQGRGPISRIIGIDRLDYTKGLPQKFKAFGRFLDKIAAVSAPGGAHPDRAPDARERGGLFRHSPRAGNARRLHQRPLRRARLGSDPLHPSRHAAAAAAAIYRSSRIGMVTPLRDGMNLVAKEYVAAQDPDDPGVLILSRFAGAAEELGDALIVNPYNIEETADVIRTALEMSQEERSSVMRR